MWILSVGVDDGSDVEDAMKTPRPGTDDETKQAFGRRLRALRDRHDMSVLAVQAALFGLGRSISEQSWRNWENGKALPAITIINDLARVLSCEVDDLVPAD